MASFNYGNAAKGAATGAAFGSIIPGIGTGIGALAGGALGGFFGGGGEDEITPRIDYPYLAAGDLYNWANEYRKKYNYDPAAPYTGKLSAEMGTTENLVQNLLPSYVQSETPTSLTAANKYNTDVLSGSYDPRTSPYYQNMKTQILKDAEEAGAAVRHNAATSGMLQSDPRHIQERKLTENVSDQLSTLLGQMYENERERMSTAAGQSSTIANALTQIPLTKLTAGSTIGAIPREVEQSALDKLYEEYQRQVQGASVPYTILSNLSGQSYQPYNAQSYSTGQDTSTQMSNIMMQLLPLLLAAA